MADPKNPTTTPATTPNAADSKSAKYAGAVARATKTVDVGGATAPIGNVAAMFSKFEASELNAMAESGKYEFAPQMLSLEPGMKIEGTLEGYGSGNLFVQDDGTERFVNSWIIASRDGTLRASILSSSQLDTKLPPFIGLPVVIARNADIKLAGGHRCGDYHVGGPRLANGEMRKWGTTNTPAEIAAAAAKADEDAIIARRMLEAGSQPQLAAGNGVAEHQAS